MQRRQIRVSRLVNAVLGLILILFGSNLYRLGEIWEGANRVLGAFGGPLFGIFLLGMFVKGATTRGVLLGGLVGVSFNCYVAFAVRELNFLWPYLIGVLVTLIAGYLTSRILPSPEANQAPLTWRRVMSQDASA